MTQFQTDEHGIPVLYQNPATRRGGQRPGAGAPIGNLNHLVHGGRSKLLKAGIQKMADDPMMRAVLYIIARLALNNHIPAPTRRLIVRITNQKGR